MGNAEEESAGDEPEDLEKVALKRASTLQLLEAVADKKQEDNDAEDEEGSSTPDLVAQLEYWKKRVDDLEKWKKQTIVAVFGEDIPTAGESTAKKDPAPPSDYTLPSPESYLRRVPNELWRSYKTWNRIDDKRELLLVATRVQKKASSGDDLNTLQPFKLAINSYALLNHLSKCTGQVISENANVLVRPFKYLVYHRDEVLAGAKEAREEFERAGLRCGAREHPTNEAYPGFYVDAYHKHNGMASIVKFMEEDMKDIFEIRSAIESQSVSEVEFINLWHAFKPGGWVFHQDDLKQGKAQGYRILHVTGGQEIIDIRRRKSENFNPNLGREFDSGSERESRAREQIRPYSKFSALVIDVVYTDCDGSWYGAKGARFVIPPFSGKRPFCSLPVVPAEFRPDFEDIRKKLLERGKLFIKLATGAHMKYSATTLQERRSSSNFFRNYNFPSEEIDSEVIVDQVYGVQNLSKQRTYGPAQWSLSLGGKVLKEPTATDSRETFDALTYGGPHSAPPISDTFDDSFLELTRRANFLNAAADLFNLVSMDSIPSEDSIALLPTRIYGYALLNRKWFPLNIEKIEAIDPIQRKLESSYDDLVLPKDHKKLLQAMIKNQVEYNQEHTGQSAEEFQMDLVKGKGRGIIILLHGVPGVGKTSTAECIAAQLNRPLLPITCGDLGLTPSATAASLEEYCNMSYKWRCVLLLDEADVFLAKREKGDVKRNALVSVFLRTLEYYSGVLILTTNRVGEFDEAFRSRIHMSLYYPRLETEPTRRIWENNIERIKRSTLNIDIEEDAIRRFARRHWKETQDHPSKRWNGRQIKNAFQTALALANWDYFDERDKHPDLERPLLRAKHFERIAETSEHFDDYITEVHGIHDEDPYAIIAAREELRKDDYVPKRTMRERESERHRDSSRRNERRGDPRRPTRKVTSRYGYESEIPDEVTEDDDSEVRAAKRVLRESAKKKKSKKPVYSDDDDDRWD